MQSIVDQQCNTARSAEQWHTARCPVYRSVVKHIIKVVKIIVVEIIVVEIIEVIIKIVVIEVVIVEEAAATPAEK